ncbi:MAG: hypothetical protein ACRD0O_00110 [Acidimicrobiia bacterium]
MPDLDFPVEDEARPIAQAIDHAAGDIAEPDVEVIDEPEIVLEPTRSRRRLAALLAAAAIVITGAAALAINMSDGGNDTAGGTPAGDSTAGGRYDCRPFGHPAVARPC